MKRTCKLVIENGRFITGVKIGEMFFPFENVNVARETMKEVIDESENSYNSIQNAALKLMNEQKSKNDDAINEIVEILIKNNLIPVVPVAYS